MIRGASPPEGREVLVDLVLVVAAHDLGEVAGRGVFEEVAELSVNFRLHVA